MQSKRLVSAVTCCALLLATETLRADDATSSSSEASAERASLRVGARVRINESDPKTKTLTGQVLRLDDLSLLLQVREDAAPVEIRRSDIRSLEVSLGRHHHAKAGAVIGGILGGVVATVLIGIAAAFFENSCGGSRGCSAGEIALGVGLFYGTPAAGLGAALGALVGRGITTDEWQTPTPRRISVHVVPTGQGVAASLSFRF